MVAEIWVPIITTIIGSITTLFVIQYKHKLNRQKEDDTCPIHECITEDTIVLSKLKEILDDTSADRVSIFSFHNGGHFYSGKSMQKMSMSYEELDNGISSIMMSKQNIPVSACITTLKPLIENGEFYSQNVKEYPEGLCKYNLLEDGVKSTYMWPIIDLLGKCIGVIRVDYVKRKTKISDDDAKKYETLSNQLPGYLEGHKK
jgi:hypothetical protein